MTSRWRNRIRILLPCLLFLLRITGLGQGVLREYWLDLPGTSIADLVNASAYPDQPNGTNLVTIFEAPTNWTNNYGTRLRGYVHPPQTGNFTFWISGDDQCELYLSSDEQPANKSRIATVRSWTNARQWDKETNQQSRPISLTAGRKYYIEALQKEGGGGDSLAVGWQWPNKSLERPIPGSRLSPYRETAWAPLIREPPAGQVVEEGASASFHCVAEGRGPLEFQWYRDGLLLAGENSFSLLLERVALGDDGASFYCQIRNSLGQTNSTPAILRVVPETSAPVLQSRWPGPETRVSQLSQVEVTFSEPVQGVDHDDLQLNGQPALAVAGFGAGPYTFRFPPARPGPADLAWNGQHQITDLSVSSNAFQAENWLVQVQPELPVPQVRLNEFLALNLNAPGLKDEDGELQPWMEIFNAGATVANLSGWALSDDPKQPGKWVFPEWILPPGEFVIVFASGKNRADTASGRFHANFKLNPSGEYLALFDSEMPRRLISEISPAYPEQRPNYSYGRDRAGDWTYLSSPTPGQANAESGITRMAPSVHFSVAHGCFSHPFNLQLSTEGGGATVRYTLDGSEPDETTGLVYVGPIRLSQTSIVRAAAFQSNCLPSRVVTQTYLFNLQPALRSLPILSLVTAPENLLGPTGILGISGGKYGSNGAWTAVKPGDYHNPSKRGLAWERPVSAELIHSGGPDGFTEDAGLRVHSSVWFRPRLKTTSKFSYRLYFRGEYGAKKLQYSLFADSPVQSFDQLVVRAGNNDQKNPFITDELVRRLFIDTGQVGLHGTFVTLFVNGQYKGYYNPTERVTPDFCQSYYGGAQDWDVIAQGSTVMDGDAQAWSSLRQFITAKSLLLPDHYRAAALKLDLTNFVDYLLVNIYAATGDWPHNNWRAARQRSPQGLFRFYIWDAEHAFGLYDIARVSRNVFTQELAGSSEIPTLYKNLKKSPEFKLFFADRIQKHFFQDGALTDSNVLSRYNECKTVLAALIPQMNANIPRTWIPTRRATLFKHFRAEGVWPDTSVPVFSRHGGLVAPGYKLEMRATNTIYFTTNGSDPRQPFTGQVAAEAIPYREPVPIDANFTIQARALHGTNWSALTEATFSVPALAQPLRIAEVMYHPPGGEAYEFLEVLNAGSSRIDLSGVSIAGLDYTFPAGACLAPRGRLVLSSDLDPAAFQARYPDCAVFGFFHGTLANAGETLTLRSADGGYLTSVAYDDQFPWPTAADGAGASLELVDPLANPSDPANWRASRIPGGTPGAASPAWAKPVVVISELMAADDGANNDPASGDWIELANLSRQPVSLAGWVLSDGSHRFVFPFDTWIDPNGFLLVYGGQASPTPGLRAGFGLKHQGETLLLFNPQMEVVDAVSFGPQVAGYTTGLLPSGWTLTLPTPAQANVAAQTAPADSACLNEWMADPPPGQDDWIELYNRHPSLPLQLDDLHLRINQGSIPAWPLSFVPPGGYLVLRANERTQSDSLPVKLPADGGHITLLDSTGATVDAVTYGRQVEGVSQGRAPDGAVSVVSFGPHASPGLPNRSSPYAGPILNEILACPAGDMPAFAELHNPWPGPVDISGFKLRLKQGDEEWTRTIPLGRQMPGESFFSVPLAELDLRQVHRAAPAVPKTAAFSQVSFVDGGDLELVQPGNEIVDRISFGKQVPGFSIGRLAEGWSLLQFPTPAEANSRPAILAGPDQVRINEVLARNTAGGDWIELYNESSSMADLSGVHITDDPSLAGRTGRALPPLSFIAPRQFILFQADSDPAAGPGHLSFSLNGLGESLYLYAPNHALLHDFDIPAAAADVAFGLYPDGTGTVLAFPDSPTPGRPNLPGDLDQDGDGLPDYWELAYGLDPWQPSDALLDSDQDHSSNLAEFRARTNPRDGADKLAFHSVVIEGNSLLFKFYAQRGRAYAIEFSDWSPAHHWEQLIQVNPPTESGWITVPAERERTSPQRFYRISCP